MADTNQQSNLMNRVEGILTEQCGKSLEQIARDLNKLGFREKGADPVAAAFENRDLELYLEIELDNARCIHGFSLLPFAEKEKKQRKFRW